MSNNKQIKKYLELPHRETVISTNTLQTKPFDNQKIEIMSNNKQSSVEWLAIQLWEEMNMQGDGAVFNKLLEQAKAMHKEEIIHAMSVAFMDGAKIGAINYTSPYKDWEQYYNETFGGNNDSPK